MDHYACFRLAHTHAINVINKNGNEQAVFFQSHIKKRHGYELTTGCFHSVSHDTASIDPCNLGDSIPAVNSLEKQSENNL